MESNIQQALLNSSESKKPSNSKDVESGVSGFLPSPRFSIRFVLVAAILWTLPSILLVFFFKVWSCQSSYISFTGICNKESKVGGFRPVRITNLLPLRHSDTTCCGRNLLVVTFIPSEEDPDEVIIRKGRTPDRIVKNLSYVMDDEPVSDVFNQSSVLFGGRLSWTQREDSFKLNSSMKVQCGFMHSGGAEMDPVDIQYAKKCRFVVVSGIFGPHDVPHQPARISHRSKKLFCFLMVVDEVSLNFMEESNFVRQDNDGGRWVGVWRLVLLKHPPYDEPERNVKVPKMLSHRLFPQAQYSIWIDGKIQLIADPLLILRRYLWRGNSTFAIAQHKCHRSIYDEAEDIKLQKRYAQPLIGMQMKIYYYEGMEPWSSKKTTVSDVPEGALIVREHTAMSNLFSCLWFNEVHLFTPIDQLSFGYVSYRLGDAFKLHMFPNVEYHRMIDLHQRTRDHSSPVECVTDPSDFWGNGRSMIESKGGLGSWTPFISWRS